MNFIKNFAGIFIIAETLFLCIYLFSTGFLLRKDTIEISSTCSDFKNDSKSCWLPKKYNKLIFIVIDALRYDFADFKESRSLEDAEFYKNNLKIFHELQNKFPRNARLSRFIADAPTTTFQRLKGLTTGSLPTFIEASSNFASDDIGNEDNIIDQFINHGSRIIGLGDDTWDKLFPSRFHRSYFFPSFYIHDLDTNDDGILVELENEIHKPDWDILIAHFLGVDHAGHKFGANTVQMQGKLAQMDAVIRNVVNLMDNQTLLVVAGDHGMTLSGDHGGETKDEITSALFVYSKMPIFAHKPSNIARPHTVDQIDLVSTLALLLGVPIPYSNIGTVIADMFEDPIPPLILNAKQVYRYLTSFQSRTTDLPRWNDIQIRFQSLMDNPTVSKAISFSNLAKSVCKSIWGQFDVPVMIISIFSSCALLLFYSLNLLAWRSPKLLEGFLVMNVTLLMYLCGIAASLWLMPVYLCYLITRNGFGFDPKYILSVGLFVVVTIPTFSNSFVVNEPLVTNFLVASVATLEVYRCTDSYRSIRRVDPIRRYIYQLAGLCYIGLLCCSRLGCVSFRCRQEQEWCQYEIPFFHKVLESLSFNVAFFRVVVAIALVSCPMLIMFRLKQSSTVIKNSPFMLLTIINYSSVSLYWVAELNHFKVNVLPLLSFCITMFIVIYSTTSNYFTTIREVFAAFHDGTSSLCRNLFIFDQKCVNRSSNDFTIKLVHSYGMSLANIFISIVVILSSGYAFSISLMLVMAGCALFLHSSQVWLQATQCNLFNIKLLPIVMWFLMSQEGFYVTGHQTIFATIHWHAAFVGFSAANNLSAVVLIGIDTFSSQIIFGLTCPLLFLGPILLKFYRNRSKDISGLCYDELLTSLAQYCASYIMIHAIKVIMTSMAALVLRRHLMLWAIFAPHFMFEAIGFGLTCLSVLLGYALVAPVFRTPI